MEELRSKAIEGAWCPPEAECQRLVSLTVIAVPWPLAGER
jgi:hypothetical protein